jgi:hypothetical protein
MKMVGVITGMTGERLEPGMSDIRKASNAIHAEAEKALASLDQCTVLFFCGAVVHPLASRGRNSEPQNVNRSRTGSLPS